MGYMYNKVGVPLEYVGLSQEECKDMCSELGDDVCFGYSWADDPSGNEDVRAARSASAPSRTRPTAHRN